MGELVLKKAATYADLEAVSPLLVAEILGGELVTHPMHAPKNGLAATALKGVLGPFFNVRRKPGSWILLWKPEVHLADDVIVPDIAGWRSERWTVDPDAAWVDIAPDWVCEVLSPLSGDYDRGIKLKIYAREGVTHLWYLDPRINQLEVFDRCEGGWRLLATFANNDKVTAAPFTSLTFDLADLWPFDTIDKS